MQKYNGRHTNITRKIFAGIAASSAFMLCACGSNVGGLTDNSSIPVPSVGPKSVARIAVADGYQKTSYIVGEKFDPRGMEVSLTYTDGSKGSIAVTEDMISGEFDTSDFQVIVTPPEYDQEPELGQPSSRQVLLTYVNEKCEDMPYQFRLHTKGNPLNEKELPTPHAPSDDVYFDGWYFDEEFLHPIDFANVINEHTMIYAKWLDIDYSVIEADCEIRTATLNYQGEITEFEYKVYKNVDEWYFDFEREKKGSVIGDEVDLIYEADDEFSSRGLYMTGGKYGERVRWGMPVNKGMVVEFDTSTPGSRTVKLEFAGRTFEYPITVTAKTLITSEGATVSDNGQLLNLSGNSGRYLLPENTYSVPDDFSARLSSAVRNNVREIVCPISVTRIGDKAFSGLSRLESVTIGESTLYIGDNAFYGCTNLKSLYVYAKEPPYIMNSHFLFDLGVKVKIYVPHELLDVYVTSPHWCNYAKYMYAI